MGTSNEIKIDGKTLEEVEEYIYLGQRITLKKDNDGEIKRRIKIGWKTFGMNRDVLKSKMPRCLKRKKSVVSNLSLEHFASIFKRIYGHICISNIHMNKTVDRKR